MNWDNLRYVLTLADAGTIAEAARELGVNRTTVLRRVHVFEQSIRMRVFDRVGSTYTLTADADLLLQAARSIDGTVTDLQRKIAGSELRLEGVLRVTTTDAILLVVGGDLLASFQALHPYVKLELVLTNSLLNLTRRDADVAIRPSPSSPELLVGERICDIGFGVYATAPYLDAHPESDIAAHQWLCSDESLSASRPGQWLLEHVPERCASMRADSFVALRDAAERGLGLALLPAPLGDLSPALLRLECPKADVSTGLWVLTHKDLAGSARVRAFMIHAGERVDGYRDRIRGRYGNHAAKPAHRRLD